MADIQTIAEQLSELTVMQVSELAELLSDRLNVSHLSLSSFLNSYPFR